MEALEQLQVAVANISITSILTYAFALLFLLHRILHHFDIASLSLEDVAWQSLVYITPARVVLDLEQRKALPSRREWSQRHAAKSEAMMNALGIGRQALIQQMPGAASIARRLSMVKNNVKSNAPAGLGNWDNSCYQNSVLQGLTALKSFETFLSHWRSDLPANSTLHALQETTSKLRDTANNGRHIWTPAVLKSMSSWQQQDAQEYFSKIMDEVDKEIRKTTRPRKLLDGLETVGEDKAIESPVAEDTISNPLEGLLAQQVKCTTCGFTEGLSMIAFNCLTVPIGDRSSYDISECLDEYTKLEPITDVECSRCTLLKTEKELQRIAAPASQLPPELREQVMKRLQQVEESLRNDDFSDEALKQCQISKKTRVLSTKTRQALVGRAPHDLVFHVNRSVFDEFTGTQRKNYASVQYPSVLDMGRWVLGSSEGPAGMPREGLWKYIYRLKAIVTHYGRHENGHYIAYRQAPTGEDDEKLQWWQLSDEDVSACSEQNVLDQSGVFMLFYERVPELEQSMVSVQDLSPEKVVKHASPPKLEVCLQPLEQDDRSIDVAMSEASTTEDEADFDDRLLPAVQAIPRSPIMMRTANDDKSNDDHWNVGRYVAAS